MTTSSAHVAHVAVTSYGTCGLPDAWRHAIVRSVAEAVGAAQIFLIGSRSRGEGAPQSDCDISVVLPSRKMLMAVRRLPLVSASLSRTFGVSVSVNPVPKWLFDHAHHNLYLLKIRVEGMRLDAAAGEWSEAGSAVSSPLEPRRPPSIVEWDTSSPSARRAEVSYLLSAVHTLLDGIDPENVRRGSLDARAEAALRKARAQVAQSYLLERGLYMTSAAAAVKRTEQLRLLPVGLTGLDGFFALRERLLKLLGPNPVSGCGLRPAARDLQYVALSALRRHRRWSILCHHRGIEASLASASLELLQSLSPDQPNGCDIDLVRRASVLLPSVIQPLPQEGYGILRDVILSEWASAQPLVGIIP